MANEELLEKIADGTATPADRAAFQEWITSLSSAEKQQVMMDMEAFMPELIPNEQADENLLAALLVQINQTKVVKLKRSWYRFAAAAIFILALGVAYWMIDPFSTYHPSVSAPITALVPGGNKAVLTLASGEQIVLNGANNGNIADQNGVQIIKLDSGLLSYKGKASQIGYNTLSTPRGGQYQVELPDGSHVWINSASTLRYPTAFVGKTREVELNGEAYFEVFHDPSRPFQVKVKELSVNVLGTGFNIMAYEDEAAIRTTLVHGSVEVSVANKKQRIEPGEQASVTTGKDQFQISKPDIDQVLAWKNGQFLFSNMSIKAIMRQVSRWYDVEVVYEGEPSNKVLGGGMPKTKVADSLLAILEETGLVKFKVTGRKIIVLPGESGN